MYCQPLNRKKYFCIILSVFWGTCLFSLVSSSAFAKNTFPASLEKSPKDIEKKLENLTQRFNPDDRSFAMKGRGPRNPQDNPLDEMEEDIIRMERELQDLKKSLNQIRDGKASNQFRGRYGMREGMLGKKHGSKGMGHGRMHGRRFLGNTEP